MPRKNKKCIVLIQILVKLYGQFTNKFGSPFYFLERETKHIKKIKSGKLHVMTE